jgi:hypothetical protein
MNDEQYQLSANKFSGKHIDFFARSLSYAYSKAFDDILYGYKGMVIMSKVSDLDPKDDAQLILI